jgi:cytochrome b561
MESINTPFFKSAKPLSIRIWHWLTFAFFLATLTTVIFGSTLFKTRDNISTVQEQVERKGGMVTKDQAKAVAHEFSDKLWMLHKNIGYFLSFLMLMRIIIEVKMSKEEKLFNKIKSTILIQEKSVERTHYLRVNYSYVIFYLLFLLMSLTGLVIAFEDQKWLDPIHGFSKDIHENIQWGLYAFIVFHIVGVVMADNAKYGGIVSRMINGRKES